MCNEISFAVPVSRKKLANYFLRKESKSLIRTKRFFNLKNADSFLILFDANSQEETELVNKYILYLKDLGKKVTSLAFFNNKELSPAFKPSLNSVFLTKKQLNWLSIPKSDAVSNLITTEFDVLINFVVNDVFPLTYVSALSKAQFKIGKFDNNYQNYYDFMIDMGQEQKLKSFMKQVDHYLGLIQPKSTKHERI